MSLHKKWSTVQTQKLFTYFFADCSVGGFPESVFTNQWQNYRGIFSWLAFWDLEKTMLHEIRVSETVVSPILTKIPHLHVHKPKTVVMETVLVIFV